MKEIIQIIEHNGKRAVNARELYAFLRVGKDFSSWIKKQINRCDLIEYQDFEVFTQRGGETYKEADRHRIMRFLLMRLKRFL